MRLKVVIPRETLMTLRAFKWFLARMRTFVVLQNVLVPKRSVAHRACELLVAVVARLTAVVLAFYYCGGTWWGY